MNLPPTTPTGRLAAGIAAAAIWHDRVVAAPWWAVGLYALAVVIFAGSAR